MNASDTNFRYSNKNGTRNDGYYETISNQKKRWLNFSKYKNSKKNKNIHKNTNRQKTESDVGSKDNGRSNDARYESLPLPNERQINEWKMRIQQGILNDSFQPQETIKGSTQTLRSNLLNPRERSKQDEQANKYPFYEEVAPPVKNRKDSKKSHNANDSESSSPYYHELEQTKIESDQKDKTIDDGPEYFVLEKIDSTSKVSKYYQSLHRELEGPLPAYEPYRPPETSDKSESGDQLENDNDVKT
ncbi:uncharacterized protein LOC124441257 [Xenia sp. Carnegie-2017]|uniref:uncharacterized protein LOC124441257 n=1 Tax=Xenia sp. Carnegie-2017 TaxID=2897299 RepID=UPI001F03929F|nr:uncharacterized protein LOC124441257 [Xenia sp. Carnegie-2017]